MAETINWYLVRIAVRDKSDAELSSEYFLSHHEFSTLEEMRVLRSSGRISRDRYVFVYGGTPAAPSAPGTRAIHLPAIVAISQSAAPEFQPSTAYDKLRRKTTRDRAAEN